MTENIHTLDTRGLSCPLPILKTKKAISALASGEVLEIKATDPGSVKDLDSFCQQTGNEMIASESVEDGFLFRIRKV
ncbi:MAG: sulfurtransferase TusA family protein [Candidatus Thiodiazotropha taylori]